MKNISLFIFILFLIGCSHEEKKKIASAASADTLIRKVQDSGIVLHKLKKLFVTGDFDGDGKQDTVFQHNYSRKDRQEIDSSADPYNNDWDTVEKWFYDKESDVYLAFNKNGRDTLHTGVAQGLYCLINVGDLNHDGKEEIALVIDVLDMSRVNTCEIYSLCNNKWTEMQSFSIYEGAFDFTEEEPVFTDIKGFLEKQNGKWVFIDYHQEGYDNPEDVGKMKPLKIPNCNSVIKK